MKHNTNNSQSDSRLTVEQQELANVIAVLLARLHAQEFSETNDSKKLTGFP